MAPAGGRDARAVGRGGSERGRGRGGESDRRVRRRVLQPADLAQRRAGGHRRVVPGRGAGRPGGRGSNGHPRPPGAGLRRRRDVVRGRELPPVRASGSAPRDGLGPPGRRGRAGGPTAGRQARGGAPGARAHRAARLHLPRPQGLAVRRVAGAADVPRAVGGRRRAAEQPRSRSLGLAPRALRLARAIRRAVRLLPARDRLRAAEHPLALRPLLVGAAGDGAGAAGRQGQVAAGEHAAREPGARDPASRRSLRQPGVRRVRRRPRPPGPTASHPARERSALAARSGDRLVRGSRPLLVSLHPGAQRAATRRRLPAAFRRGVRGLRRVGRLGLGARPLGRALAHPGGGPSLPPRRGRAVRAGGAHGRAAVASERRGLRAARPMGAGEDRRRRVRPPTGALRARRCRRPAPSRHRSGRREAGAPPRPGGRAAPWGGAGTARQRCARCVLPAARARRGSAAGLGDRGIGVRTGRSRAGG